MSQANTCRSRQISGHPGPVPGAGAQREDEVCKYIDVTTCIGCKACEVACVEWNDMPFQRDDLRQHLPDDAVDGVELLEPDQVQRAPARRRHAEWLMRKDQCMHCEDPGCLRACPADGAIVQYTNGIVDFQQENCIGCQYCVTGCPFDIPKFNPTTKKVYKCTLCSDRVGQGLEPACIKACPTGCLQFGTKADMRALAESARAAAARALGLRRTPASTIRRRSAAPTSSTCCTTSPSPSCTAACRRIRRFRRATRSGSASRSRSALLLALLRRAGRVLPLRDRRAEGAAAAGRERCRDDTAVERFDERRAPASSRTDARSCTTTSCCAIRSTRACCTGAWRSSSSSRCCPGSRSTRRGSFAG